MNRLIYLLAVAVTALLCSSCLKEQLEATYSSQEEKIDSFIKSEMSKNEDYEVVHNKGANRLILKAGEGDPLAADGTVTFRYAGYVFTGSIAANNMFSTNDEETAKSAGWNITDINLGPYSASPDDKHLVKGLKNGLTGVKKGEECYIIFSGKYGFGNKSNGIIEKNSALLYHIWVEDVVNR